MSRPARIISKSGMYHIIFRGINRQNLFEEESDKIRLTDDQLKRKMLEIAKVEKLSDIALQNKQDRNTIIRNLRNNRLSIRDIERMTGISRGVISRV